MVSFRFCTSKSGPEDIGATALNSSRSLLCPLLDILPAYHCIALGLMGYEAVSTEPRELSQALAALYSLRVHMLKAQTLDAASAPHPSFALALWTT